MPFSRYTSLAAKLYAVMSGMLEEENRVFHTHGAEHIMECHLLIQRTTSALCEKRDIPTARLMCEQPTVGTRVIEVVWMLSNIVAGKPQHAFVRLVPSRLAPPVQCHHTRQHSPPVFTTVLPPPRARSVASSSYSPVAPPRGLISSAYGIRG